MASPYAAGVAALLRKQESDATYGDLRYAIRRKVDTPPALNGKVVYNGRLERPAGARGDRLAGRLRPQAGLLSRAPEEQAGERPVGAPRLREPSSRFASGSLRSRYCT